jgi:hypothetical protein
VSAADIESVNVGSATAVISILVTGLVFVAYGLRRRLLGGASNADVAAAQRNFLVSNWSEVEAAAARSGMNADEIAEVRKRLIGA